jgi:anti-sigma-K factor RskA
MGDLGELLVDCKDCADQILLFAAGALSDDEAAAVREHLSTGCPRCAGRMAEAEATLSLLALTLPPDMPSEQVRQKLLDRLATERRPAAPLLTNRNTRLNSNGAGGPPWWMQLAIPSAIAASIAAAGTIFFMSRIEQRNSDNPVSVVALNQTIGQLTAIVQQKEHELSTLRAAGAAQTVQWASDRGLKFLQLDGTDKQPPGAAGNIFWDTDRGVWHFYAAGLKPVPAGKTYELWFVTNDGKTVPAGQFDPDVDGAAAIMTPVSADLAGKFAAAAVTDEAAGSADTHPSGTFQLTLSKQ